jgi:hypothetical protein
MADTIETLTKLREMGARKVTLYPDGQIQRVDFGDPVYADAPQAVGVEDLIKAMDAKDDDPRPPALQRMLDRRSAP